MTNQTLISPSELACGVPQPAEPSPFIIEFFMVQGVGFRCMAYCDEEGRWRNAFNNDELFGEITILE